MSNSLIPISVLVQRDQLADFIEPRMEPVAVKDWNFEGLKISPEKRFVSLEKTAQLFRSRFNAAGSLTFQSLFEHKKTGVKLAVNEPINRPGFFLSIEEWPQGYSPFVFYPYFHEEKLYPLLYHILDGRSYTDDIDKISSMTDDELFEHLEMVRQRWWMRSGTTYDFEQEPVFFPFPEREKFKIYSTEFNGGHLQRSWLFLYERFLSFEVIDKEKIANRYILPTDFKEKAKTYQKGFKGNAELSGYAEHVFQIEAEDSENFSAVRVGNKGQIFTTLEAATLSINDKKETFKLSDVHQQRDLKRSRVIGQIERTGIVVVKSSAFKKGLPPATKNPGVGDRLRVLAAHNSELYFSDCTVFRTKEIGQQAYLILTGVITDEATGGALIDDQGRVRGIILGESFSQFAHSGEPIFERRPGTFIAIGIEELIEVRPDVEELKTFKGDNKSFLKLVWKRNYSRIRFWLFNILFLSFIGILCWTGWSQLDETLRLQVSADVRSAIGLGDKSECRTNIVISSQGGNLRERPSTNAKLMAQIDSEKLNVKCVVLNQLGEPWFEVEVNGMHGYVRADIVSILDTELEDDQNGERPKPVF